MSDHGYVGHKYGSARDEVLDAMAAEGWANMSSGNVESPTGWFALVVNRPAEVTEIMDAFGDDDLRHRCGAWSDDEIRAELTGAFIVLTDSNGLVDVAEYETPGAAGNAYKGLEDAYGAWFGRDDDQ